MEYLKGLNDEQMEAVLTPAKYVRVIAGAGSGKTRVLTTRLIYLMEQRHYSPYKLCAITFTNKAAKEMKERMELMNPNASKMHISTIHALCVRILREDYEAADLIRNFTILDSSDQNAVLKEIYKDIDIDKKQVAYRQALNFISDNKTQFITPTQVKKMGYYDEHHEILAEIYMRYERRLKNLFALDFDDLLIVVRNVLMQNEKVRTKWQQRFDSIFVDEFQDVDKIQYQIIKDLVGEKNDLYVVGDPDQTIYTWRGANVTFMLDFNSVYPEAQTIVLNQNYRSTQAILDSANELISHNKNRSEKDLFANKESEECVKYYLTHDAQLEADFIARKLMGLKEDGESYLDMAVLYRSNYLSRALEKSLMQRQIPYVVYGGLRFYDHKEVKDFVNYLRMITHGDDLALRRTVQTPRRGIGEKTLDTYFERARDNNQTIYEVMLSDYHLNKGSAKIRSYVEVIEEMKAYHKMHNLEDLMAFVLRSSGLYEFYHKLKEENRLENMKELIADAIQYEQNNPEGTLADYVQMVSLYGEREEVIEGEYVRLMTVHAAKGLEFDNVIIMGLADSVFPNKNSIMEGVGGIEEERRLMYVAMTRAKERLFLTSNSGFSYVTGMYARPSRFIDELDTGKIIYEHKPVESKQVIDYDGPTTTKKIKIKVSDLIYHDEFGEGIVIRVEDETLKIAFNYPFGTKIISRKYAGLKNKGDLS